MKREEIKNIWGPPCKKRKPEGGQWWVKKGVRASFHGETKCNLNFIKETSLTRKDPGMKGVGGCRD